MRARTYGRAHLAASPARADASATTLRSMRRLEVRLNKPTLIDELIAYLRSLGHEVTETGYGTLHVDVDGADDARLEFHLTIWEAVRSLEHASVRAEIVRLPHE
jgi:hypothetical protein